MMAANGFLNLLRMDVLDLAFKEHFTFIVNAIARIFSNTRLK